MPIHLAETDDQIQACFPVMSELRPHLVEAGFVDRIRQQQAQGYQLACLEVDGRAVAVAGFRLLHNLAWGRFLYVDDLVTLAAERSHGHGAALLGWLRQRAIDEGCDQFHLDSGTQRVDAHRFYLREGMAMTSYHFAETLPPTTL